MSRKNRQTSGASGITNKTAEEQIATQKTANQDKESHSVGVLFDHGSLNDAAYGEKAYITLLGCLDFRHMGDCTIVSGDADIASDIYVIGFQDIDIPTANYIIERVTDAYYIYGGGIPMSRERNGLFIREFYLNDEAEVSRLHDLGSVLYQFVTMAWAADCDALPLLTNGKIANGVIEPRDNSLLWQVMTLNSSLSKRLNTEAMEGFLARATGSYRRGSSSRKNGKSPDILSSEDEPQ
jgi:hypothetical protein